MENHMFRYRSGGLGRRLAAVAAALALASVAACSTSSGESDDGRKALPTDAQVELLTWAVTSDLRSLDLAHAHEASAEFVIMQLLEPMLTLDDTGALTNVLAESWSQPDDLTYVYKLVDGVKFWNGDPLTAEDAAFSIARNLGPDQAAETASYFVNVDSVEASGPLEVTIHLKEPDPYINYYLAYAPVVQESYAKAQGDKLGSPEGLTMGTGPYEPKDFSPAEGVTLVRNDNYWGPEPRVKQAEIKVISDPDSLRLALQAGDIDGTFQQPLSSTPQWDDIEGVNTFYAPGNNFTMLSMDVNAPPFDDVHVRRAVAYSIDREGLVDSLFHGKAEPALYPVKPSMWVNLADEDEVDAFYDGLASYPFDMEKAADELAASGHPDGFEVTVPYDPSRPELGQILQTLAENMKSIGVTIKLEEMPTAQWVDLLLGDGASGLQIIPEIGTFADPGFFVEKNIVSTGLLNVANYGGDDEMIDLVETTRTGDSAQRLDVLKSILERVQDEAPYAPIYYENATMALSDEFVYDGEYSSWTNFYGQWLPHVKLAAD
jgi:peptide/nickel transport system substrate-binding protein